MTHGTSNERLQEAEALIAMLSNDMDQHDFTRGYLPHWRPRLRAFLEGRPPTYDPKDMPPRPVVETAGKHADLVRAIFARHDRCSKLLWGPAALPGMMLGPEDADAAHHDRGTLLSLLNAEQRGDVETTCSCCGWQPIATCPNGYDQFIFWLVPTPPAEAYTDTNGNPITTSGPGMRFIGKHRAWGSLYKATHWRRLPDGPAVKSSCESSGKIPKEPQ